jgi:ketosteroid isomerase-like protein
MTRILHSLLALLATITVLATISVLAPAVQAQDYDRYGHALRHGGAALEPVDSVSRDDRVRAGIAQASRQVEAAFARQDADAFAAIVTAGVTLFPPAAEPIEGREAVRALVASWFAAGIDGLELTTHEVLSTGDLAYEFGTSRVRAGGAVVDEAKYVHLWQRDGDTWRLHRDLWNSSLAPPAPAASN